MSNSRVLVQKRDGFIILTINDPPVNSLSRKVIEDLDRALEHVMGDKDSKCIVVTGDGKKVFVSGADIRELENLDEASAIMLVTRVKEVLS